MDEPRALSQLLSPLYSDEAVHVRLKLVNAVNIEGHISLLGGQILISLWDAAIKSNFSFVVKLTEA